MDASVTLAFIAVLCSIPAGAQTPEHYRIAAAGDWIQQIEPDYQARNPSGGVADGAWIVLFDRQVDVRAAGDQHFQHVAVKVLNAVGVREYSQIDLVVDPAFQSLVIHRLQIVRDGMVIDHRRSARISELAQEPDRRNRIYNGRYNVNIVLQDIRAGDVVEYSYTLQSKEMLFPGHYGARFDIGWSIPVHRQRIRLRAPAARSLRLRASDGGSIPPPRLEGDVSEWVLEWADRPAIPANVTTPGWYTVWPYVEVSDLESWAAVSRLVDPMYRPPRTTPPAIAAVAEEIRGGGGSRAEQAGRALQYVQQEIRYTSIAIGRGSHEPASPDIVMERRFGDCKDKSLLLATLLSALGVDARVALVHSSRRRALDDVLPTPYAFDHAIVRAEIDGTVYWLDATAAPQMEPLAANRPADFERALTLTMGSERLENIPAPASDTRRREVVAVLDLREGLEAPALLELTTQYGGGLADVMRDVLAQGSLEQRQSDFETYIARYYPSARSLGPPEVRVDVDRKVVELRERYRLDAGFALGSDGLLALSLHADELYDYAEPLGAGARRAPLSLEYPIRVSQRLQAHLPEEWWVKAESLTIENPAFRYHSDVTYSARTVTVSYEYEALADHVPAAEIARYEADRARMYEDLGYRLTYNPSAFGGDLAVAPLPMLVSLAVLVLSIWGAVRWGYRFDPQPRPSPAEAPRGIRGWLLLRAVSLIVILPAMIVVVAAWLPMVQADQWSSLPSMVSDGYAATAQLAVLAFLGFSIALTVLLVLTAVLFFRKRSSAPRFVIVSDWLTVTLLLAVSLWAGAAGLDPEADTLVRDSIRDVASALLWTAYMLRSRRVAATFVRRRPPHVSPPVDAPAAVPVG